MLINAIRIVGLFAAGAAAYVMVRVLWPDVKDWWRIRSVRRRLERHRKKTQYWQKRLPDNLPRYAITGKDIRAAIKKAKKAKKDKGR